MVELIAAAPRDGDLDKDSIMATRNKNKKRAPSISVGELESLVAKLAPPDLADEWDNVGLLIGDPNKRVEAALVALELDGAVLKEAKARGVQAVVVHHPLIFKAFKKLKSTHPVQRLVLETAASGIAVIAAHTNLDRAPGGTNQALADHIGLENRAILFPSMRDDRVKFVVFVPLGHEAKIIEAIGRAGAGIIGDYSHCTFRAPGTGTYLPLEGANPFAGEIGKLEQAEETRLECVVERMNLSRLLREVRAVHPYEEMAYDVHPMIGAETRFGLGLTGELPKTTPLKILARNLKRDLGASGVRVVGDLDRAVRRVALCTGSGGDVVKSVSPGRADVFITGEMDHHDAAEAKARGLAVICVGHFESEVIVVPYVAAWLREQSPIADNGVRILEAATETSPFTII